MSTIQAQPRLPGSVASSREVFFALPILILIITLWPNYLLVASEAGRRAATLALIGAVWFVGQRLVLRSPFTGTKTFVLLVGYFVYVLGNLVFNQVLGGGGVVPGDIAEVLRAGAIVMFYKCGIEAPKTVDLGQVNRATAAFFAIFALLIVNHLSNLPGVQDIIQALFTTRRNRFYGSWGSVNYIWVPVSTVLFLWLLLRRGQRPTLVRVLQHAAVLLTSVVGIALSGSRTSMGAVAGGLLIVLAVGSGRVHHKRSLARGILRFAGRVLLPIGVVSLATVAIDFLTLSSVVHSRLGELEQIAQGDLEALPTIAVRQQIWGEAAPTIRERIVFGHGPSKSGIRLLDNSYLMSVYRYGIVGLLIELGIYFSLLVRYVLLLRGSATGVRSPIHLYPIVLLLQMMVSMIPANTFYELKSPYLLFFIFGFFDSRVQIVRGG